MARDTTDMPDEEFDREFPPGSSKRQEQEREYPRAEPQGQSDAPDAAELEEFRQWKEEKDG